MSTPPGFAPSARFGPFVVDFRAGELLKNGGRIGLQDQLRQVLALLLEHPGETLTREELHKKLWPNDTFVDFDHGLNNAINRLRETLCDSAENPRYIETLPRRGYRFISAIEGTHQAPAMVSVAAGAAPLVPEHEQRDQRGAAPTERVKGKGVLRPAAFSAFAVVAAATLVYLLNVGDIRQKLFVNASSPKIQSLAVLPLANLTGDPGQEYFADGMTDALITDLAQIGALRVISRQSVIQYRGSKKPLPQIAHELHVDAVVEGVVLRSGERGGIDAQLIEAASDRHLWVRSYERDVRDVVALEGEVAQAIGREIEVKLTPQEQARLARSRPVNPAAYDNYLRAKYLFLLDKPHNENAIALLERAVALDPDFALAYAALSRAYRIKGAVFVPQDSGWEEKALASLAKALSLVPDLPEAHLAKGFVLWSHSDHFPHEASIREMQRALVLNPNLDEAHHQLANVYNHIGLLDKASAELQKAVALDPNNTGARYRVGINLLYQCKYQEALGVLGDSQEFHPTGWGAHTAWALLHVGKREQSAARA